ncbi:sensor histidine kinase TmoS [bacterium BMS3Bbin05]|nr:sensor histidine kinase TmoS [bacterium BMS3Bbin05]
MRILIVDDNEDSRMILKKNLESSGHTIEDACNGAEALKTAMESPPDMIISDILMPVMDGFRLCREIRQDKQLCKTPFVFYTATYIVPKDEKLAMSIGASRYIIKPADTAEFLRTIKGVFQEYEEEKLPVPEKPVKERPELFRMYEESIARKLDKKVEELERVKTNLVIACNELKESEQKFRIIFDNAIDGILLADMETGKFHTGNKMICRMLGYSPEEIEKLEVRDIHPKKVLPHVIERFEKQSSGELTPAENIQVKKKDGSIFYANINSSPITLAGKRYLMGIFRDITRRVQAEEELLRSRSELSALFRVSSAIIRTMKKKKDLIRKADEALYQAKQKGRNRIEVSE